MLIGQSDLGSLSVEINFQGVKLTQLKLIRMGFFNVSRNFILALSVCVYYYISLIFLSIFCDRMMLFFHII